MTMGSTSSELELLASRRPQTWLDSRQAEAASEFCRTKVQQHIARLLIPADPSSSVKVLDALGPRRSPEPFSICVASPSGNTRNIQIRTKALVFSSGAPKVQPYRHPSCTCGRTRTPEFARRLRCSRQKPLLVQ